MKKSIFAVIFFALASCLMLTSCETGKLVPTVDSLLTPPLYYSQYKELVNALTSSIGDNIILCSPDKGDYTSAITIYDLDGDSFDDGLIFYKKTMQDDLIHFIVFKGDSTGNKWKKCGEPCEGLGNDISSLVLTDFDSDGVSEIVISWNYAGVSGDNAYSVYKVSSETFEYSELTHSNCDIARVYDFNSDSVDEIFCISSGADKSDNTRTARLLKFSAESNEFETISETPVDSLIGYYVSYKVQPADKHSPLRIYLDATKSGNQMITEVLRWDNESGELIDEMLDPETGTNTLTLRYEQIQSADVDGDGRIDIPVQTVYREPESESDSAIYLTNWTYFDGTNPLFVIKTFVNINGGYMIYLDSIQNRNLYISGLESTDKKSTWSSWTVYADKRKPSKALFTIIYVDRDIWNNGTSEDKSYIVIAERQDGLICARMNELGEILNLDIKSMVTKIPQ